MRHVATERWRERDLVVGVEIRASYCPRDTATYANRWFTSFSLARSVSTWTRTHPAVCPWLL